MKNNQTKIRSEYVKAVPGNVASARYVYFETTQQSKNDLVLIFAGHEKCARDFEIKRLTYPWYVIEYPIQGMCDLVINQKKYILQSDTIAGFRPGDSHHYKTNPHSPLEHYFIAFTGSSAADLFSQSGLADRNCLPLYDVQKISFLVESLIQGGFSGGENAQQLCSSYLKVLLLELPSQFYKNREASPLSKETFHRCKAYIDTHFSHLVLPSDAAKACNINVRYMSRLFKRYHHLTAQEYITRLKINKAASLLLSSNYAVCEVAMMSGFEDPYHFSKVFKKYHGLSPQHYRNRHLTESF